jgi:integrative and conjugative element protein (TIGR02256 family)
MWRFRPMIFLTGARLVTLSDEVTRQIQRFTEPPESNLEAGGILLGSYRGPHIEVVQCTTPMRKDARTRFGFIRRDPGHQRAADSAWRASGRTINFVGEWHTHPEDHPRPSNVDRNTWLEQMRRRHPNPLFFLIAGRITFHCELGNDARLMNMTLVA